MLDPNLPVPPLPSTNPSSSIKVFLKEDVSRQDAIMDRSNDFSLMGNFKPTHNLYYLLTDELVVLLVLWVLSVLVVRLVLVVLVACNFFKVWFLKTGTIRVVVLGKAWSLKRQLFWVFCKSLFFLGSRAACGNSEAMLSMDLTEQQAGPRQQRMALNHSDAFHPALKQDATLFNVCICVISYLYMWLFVFIHSWQLRPYTSW